MDVLRMPRKVTPYIERYAEDQYRALKGDKKNYSVLIRAGIKRYFGVLLSSERLRQIFVQAGSAEREHAEESGGHE